TDFYQLPAADHVIVSGQHVLLAVDWTLVAAAGTAEHDEDGLQLVHELRDGEERGHGAEREAAEVHVDAGEHDAHAAVGERVGHGHDPVVEELHLVHRYHRRFRPPQPHDLFRGIHGGRFGGLPVV